MDLERVTTMLPYRDYYRGRNGVVASYLARYFGIEYQSGSESNNKHSDEEIYYVPPVTQVKGETHLSSLKNSEDFYGLLVEDIGHVHKAILHKTISTKLPGFYSHEFARSVEDLVLPGVTVFTKEDIIKAYKIITGASGCGVRFKIPNESDGRDQYSVEDMSQLSGLISKLDEEQITNNGLVLETNLQEANTISVGFCQLDGIKYSFIARQKNDISPEDGRNRYLGAKVVAVKGSLTGLLGTATDKKEMEAIIKSQEFLKKYSYFDPIASRLSFDYLYGVTDKGEKLGGVTDITGRLGGTCPALVMSALVLMDESIQYCVESEVTLNYTPTSESEEELNAVRFIDLPSLRLTAKINRKVKL